MFGIAVARLDQVSEEERARYEELYCGLCRSIKASYGQISRAALSYDLAFLALLLNSLHEHPEVRGAERCVSHPAKAMAFAESAATAYAADVSVIFAYHKCLDDIADDGSMRGHAGRLFLQSAYERAKGRQPAIADACESSMARIRALEADPDTTPDAAAQEFGELLGAVFAQAGSPFEGTMAALGRALGIFVYMMDAAVDLDADLCNNSYNPFRGLDMDPDQMRTVLEALAADVALAFEKLPLEQDAHLLQSVVYAGLWQKFNQTYRDSEPTTGSR